MQFVHLAGERVSGRRRIERHRHGDRRRWLPVDGDERRRVVEHHGRRRRHRQRRRVVFGCGQHHDGAAAGEPEHRRSDFHRDAGRGVHLLDHADGDQRRVRGQHRQRRRECRRLLPVVGGKLRILDLNHRRGIWIRSGDGELLGGGQYGHDVTHRLGDDRRTDVLGYPGRSPLQLHAQSRECNARSGGGLQRRRRHGPDRMLVEPRRAAPRGSR